MYLHPPFIFWKVSVSVLVPALAIERAGTYELALMSGFVLIAGIVQTNQLDRGVNRITTAKQV